MKHRQFSINREPERDKKGTKYLTKISFPGMSLWTVFCPKATISALNFLKLDQLNVFLDSCFVNECSFIPSNIKHEMYFIAKL